MLLTPSRSALALAATLTASLTALLLATPAWAASPAASAAATASAPAAKSQDGGREVVEVDDRDPAMKAAFRKAQGSLDGFLKLAATQNPNHDAVAVRVGVVEGKRKEYIWLTPFEPDGKGYKGRVNNLPVRLQNITLGQFWYFQRKDIVDWMYVDKAAKVMHGNYTACAQLAKAPAAEVAAIKKAYGLDCQR